MECLGGSKLTAGEFRMAAKAMRDVTRDVLLASQERSHRVAPSAVRHERLLGGRLIIPNGEEVIVDCWERMRKPPLLKMHPFLHLIATATAGHPPFLHCLSRSSTTTADSAPKSTGIPNAYYRETKIDTATPLRMPAKDGGQIVTESLQN
jgi:hypothetical protein